MESSTMVDLNSVLWLAGILLGIIGTLVVAICWFFWTRISECRESIGDMDKKLDELGDRIDQKSEVSTQQFNANIATVERRIDLEAASRIKRCDELLARLDNEIKERTAKHDTLAIRVFEKIEKDEEKLSDLGETVAGFGGIYLTRQEYHYDHEKGRR